MRPGSFVVAGSNQVVDLVMALVENARAVHPAEDIAPR
jgi:hypothetical protein